MVRHLLRLDELVSTNSLLTVCEVSVLNGQNMEEVVSWILTTKQVRDGWPVDDDNGGGAGGRVMKQIRSFSVSNRFSTSEKVSSRLTSDSFDVREE